jgi:hypothetical protein
MRGDLPLSLEIEINLKILHKVPMNRVQSPGVPNTAIKALGIWLYAGGSPSPSLSVGMNNIA